MSGKITTQEIAPAAIATAATANTIMVRDANGRAQVVDGVAAQDIATKGQVDRQRGLFARSFLFMGG